MWKQLTAALLILAFTTSTFCRIAIVLDYYTNTVAYANNCINKARPQMHCNGKCQMMKKLQQEEKKEQDNQARKPSSKIEQVAGNHFYRIPPFSIPATRHATAFILIQKPVDRVYTLLRPPAAA